MKAKQVVALMMATTLAVTGNGVTTLAGEIGNTVEGTEEEAVQENELKGAIINTEAEKYITVTAEVDKTADGKESSENYVYGEEVTIKTTVNVVTTGGDALGSKVDTAKGYTYELYDGTDRVDSNTNGVFTYVPTGAKTSYDTLKVKVTAKLKEGIQDVIAEGAVAGFKVDKLDVDSKTIPVPELEDIVLKDKDGDGSMTDATERQTDVILADVLTALNNDPAYSKYGTVDFKTASAVLNKNTPLYKLLINPFVLDTDVSRL